MGIVVSNGSMHSSRSHAGVHGWPVQHGHHRAQVPQPGASPGPQDGQSHVQQQPVVTEQEGLWQRVRHLLEETAVLTGPDQGEADWTAGPLWPEAAAEEPLGKIPTPLFVACGSCK